MSHANNKGADQPGHPRGLISAFVVRCLDSVMSLVSVTKISSLMLASVAEQASLILTWSQTPKDTFLMSRLINEFTKEESSNNNKRESIDQYEVHRRLFQLAKTMLNALQYSFARLTVQ